MAVKKAQMMPTFNYEGIDRKGAKIKGELPARNLALAKVTLRKQGITIKSIREKKKNILEGIMKKKVTTLDITIFTGHHDFHSTARNHDESGCTAGSRL